jgi:hypothetical protein
MMRSYFIPLLIPAVFFVALAIIIGTAIGIVGSRGVIKPSESEIREYFDGMSDRSFLVKEATAAKVDAWDARWNGMCLSVSFCFLFGLVFLFWAIDRHRLFNRFRKMLKEGQGHEAPNQSIEGTS